MALKSFRIADEKAIRLAECESVPPVMLVAGPNGVGKSTLLYALRRRIGTEFEGETRIIYQPPHRAIRRQQVQRRYLAAGQRISEIFSGESVPGFEGLSIPFPSRAPDNVDEAGSTLKFTLGRLENRRQAVLAALVDQRSAEGRDLETGALPDIFDPIRRLTARLLPHLSFQQIDFSNESDVRCVFKRTDVAGEATLDLDDLSSGEKSIFILFLPLIEADINERLTRLDPQHPEGGDDQDHLILIDEAEQHLHPELQGRLLGYLREEAARRRAQFVVTTHSPTVVDQAFDEELYVLTFPRLAGGNQLRRVATTPERLEVVRELAGNTFAITTGRTIVCIEGAPDSGGSLSDMRLLETLHPAASRYTFVPVGGKGNVIRVVEGLRREVDAAELGIRVSGLVDRDRDAATTEGVVSWPACMIENLLLDPVVISDVTAIHGRLRSAEAIEAALLVAAREERADEIRLRVAKALGASTVRPKGLTVAEVEESIAAATAQLELSSERIVEVIGAAHTEVDKSIEDGSFLASFRGKRLLRRIYHFVGLAAEQMSYEQFSYAVAERLADIGTLAQTIEDLFRSIDNPDAPALSVDKLPKTPVRSTAVSSAEDGHEGTGELSTGAGAA